MPKFSDIDKVPKMGKVKNYLRYSHQSTFGVVAASQLGASIHYLQIRNTKDRYVAVPVNEDVVFWDLKTKQAINTLVFGDTGIPSEVTVIDCFHGGHPRSNLIAIGYGNGEVRVYEYETGDLKAKFTGHRTTISALKFDKDGSRLASGGKDCNITIWDITSEKGLFALKGHKNSITEICFLHNDLHNRDLIVSSSIDAVSTIKFWDLHSQHCFYTLSGQSTGVWSFVILKDGSRLITGSTSPELKVYSLEFLNTTSNKKIESVDNDDVAQIEPGGVISSEEEYGFKVTFLGNILRNTAAISSRVQKLSVDRDESLLFCHSIDKNIELYELRSPDQALIYAKKQAKKANKRNSKRKRELDQSGDNEPIIEEFSSATTPVNSLSDLDGQALVDCEINRKLGSHKLDDKVKALCINRVASKDNLRQYKISVMTSCNNVSSYLLRPSLEKSEQIIKKLESLSILSHRSDVRAVSISQDNSLILSVSGESVKVWRTESESCVSTIDSGYATCCVFADAQHLSGSFKNRFVIIGTKDGQLQIFDLSESTLSKTYQISDQDKQITSVVVLPDKTGIVTGSQDGIVRFFNFAWENCTDDDNSTNTRLILEEDRILEFQEGVTCVRISANGNLVAAALLDSTVRVHFTDTFKYFLTLYGHKFPVTTMDISDDNTLLATGSPDKNIKIWGLDFGDCHKSIFAHEEAITCVKFVPKTHHLFSCGRDRAIKQWDCDYFIKIQTLRKHQGEIWCMEVSSNGKFVVTGSHDKSIRIYRKTEEIIVPADEEETEREAHDERDVYEKQENIIVGETALETGFASKMTIETVKSTDRLIEAIEVFGNEQAKEKEYEKACNLARSNGNPDPPAPETDPLLMTAMTTDYNRFMLEILRRIKSSELEEILLTLPFDYVRKLLIILVILLDKGWDIELLTRCSLFLLKVNFGQVASCSALNPVVAKLRDIVERTTYQLKDCVGYNMVALQHIGQNRRYCDRKIM